MSAHLVFTFRPHWLGAWFLRLAARPVVIVNDLEHTASWGAACTVELPAGHHMVAAGIRYRGTRPVLGTEDAQVLVAEGETRRLLTVNGVLNYQPFAITAP